jgi:hypothetical protein
VKLESVTMIALAAALSASAVPLMEQIRNLRSETASQYEVLASNQRLVPISTKGIDVHGRLVTDLPTGAKRIVLVGIRNSSLQDDLRFWRTVLTLPNGLFDVHVFAYCDGAACSDAAARVTQNPGMTIMAFGETVTVQSVFNADGTGALFLEDGKMRPLRRVDWRGPGRTPETVVTELLR